jgi:hypothetical protein
MLPKIKLQIACAAGCLVFGCKGQPLERDFFNKPLGDRLERLRQYSLEDQYKIFRYGNDKIEPPLMDLADPIAERGETAISFLVDQLNSSADDLTVRDILLMFQTMASSRSYDVKRDAALLAVLTSKVSAMKHEAWRTIYLDMVQGIKDSK